MKRLPLLLTPMLTLAFPTVVHADRRYYGETYDAMIAAPGAVDVELWSTLHRAPRAGGAQYWLDQVELETGLTERWDLALYNDWIGQQGAPLRYQATRVETRYRLSQPGEWFLDPVLYLEVKKEWIEDKPFAFEEKLILGKDVGAWNISANLSAEQEMIPAGGREYEYAYAAGTSYEVARWLRVGAEAFGADQRAGGASVTSHYAGPALSFAFSRVSLVTALGFGLDDQAESLRARAVLAFQL